jgi:GH24 family phage-related lysozyme (muramidase)
MSNQLSIAYLPTLKRWEGAVPWLYLDSCGNVTIWAGLMLPDAGEALDYPLLTSAVVPTPATAQEIENAWNQVHGMQEGHLPAFYAYSGCLRISAEDGDDIALGKLDILVETLSKGISGFDGMRQAWKMALLDMIFNLGPSGLLKGFPHLIAAVEHGNGHLAAQQCHRIGVDNERNQWTVDCFSGTISA